MDNIKKIHWLLVDNHASVLGSFPSSIDASGKGIEHSHPIAIYTEDALLRLEREKIDVVLLDLRIRANAGTAENREYGWRCATDISVRFPDTRIIIISAELPDPNELEDQRGLFELGGPAYLSGYVLKDDSITNIATAIRQVVDQGTTYLARDTNKLLMQAYDRGKLSAEKEREGFLFGDPCARFLTQRYHQVMLGVARGQSNKEIANKAGLVEQTIEKYVKRCCERLDLMPTTKPMLASWAGQNCLELRQAKQN